MESAQSMEPFTCILVDVLSGNIHNKLCTALINKKGLAEYSATYILKEELKKENLNRSPSITNGARVTKQKHICVSKDKNKHDTALHATKI